MFTILILIFVDKKISDQRVSREIPKNCDTIVLTDDDSHLLTTDQAIEFKKKVFLNCPCQPGKSKCPIEIDEQNDLSIWFDEHSSLISKWPFILTKYVCNGSRINFRHFHRSIRERIRCKLISKLWAD